MGEKRFVLLPVNNQTWGWKKGLINFLIQPRHVKLALTPKAPTTALNLYTMLRINHLHLFKTCQCNNCRGQLGFNLGFVSKYAFKTGNKFTRDKDLFGNDKYVSNLSSRKETLFSQRLKKKKLNSINKPPSPCACAFRSCFDPNTTNATTKTRQENGTSPNDDVIHPIGATESLE